MTATVNEAMNRRLELLYIRLADMFHEPCTHLITRLCLGIEPNNDLMFILTARAKHCTAILATCAVLPSV